MAAFEQLFQHLLDIKVIICKRCQYAIVPAQVNGHIQRQHPSITTDERQSIVQAVTALSNIATTPESIKRLHKEDIIKELPVFQDGIYCMYTTASEVCNYVCRDLRGMQRHCYIQHQWKNPRRRGGYPKHRQYEETGQIWITEQLCQRLFQARQWPQYFAVQVDRRSSRSQDEGAMSSEEVAQHGKTILDGFFQDFERARQGDNEQRRRYEPNPWLEHTMWEKHIGPHKEWVVQMTKPDRISKDEEDEEKGGEEGERTQPLGEANGGREPVSEANNDTDAAIADSEAALEQACKATRSLIRRSYQTSRVEIVGRPAMHYVNRRESGATSNDRPFYGKQKVQTIQKYSNRFVEVLRYIWRTEAVEKRPKYRLTSTQRAALTQFQKTAHRVAQEEDTTLMGQDTRQQERQAKRRGRLTTVCSTFWIAMFDHRLGDDEYENAILSGLSVLVESVENGWWMPAINYTPILAAVITTMRAIVVYKAWRTRRNQIEMNITNGITKAYAHEGVPSVFELVKKDVDRFMIMTEFGGYPTPINTIYIQKMYGMKIRYTTKAEGQISWEGDDTVLVRKIKFSMGDVRSVVHGLLAIVRTQLVEELCILPPNPDPSEWRPVTLPRFEMSKIADNHRILDEGWSFFKDVRNEWAVDSEKWMGSRLFDDDSIRQRFICHQTEAAVEYNTDAIARYLRAVKKYKERLIVLVHLSGGAPGRSTELTSIQCENGKHARSQRGVFIDNGLMAFVTSYHKGFSASQSMKIVHRFVPQEVGEVVMYYMWLIRPFERILQRMAHGQRLFSPWLWEPEPEEEWEEEEEAMDDQDDGCESDGEETHPNTYPDELEVDHDDEIAEIVQQSTPRPESRNCDGFWNTNRVRRVMRRETANLCGVPIGISDWRQVYPAIHREFTSDRSIQETLTKIYKNIHPNAQDDNEVPAAGDLAATFRAKQAGHSIQMEENIYGRSLEQSPFTTMAEKDAFRKVSVDWHRFLQFPSAWQVNSVDPDVRRRVKQEQDDVRFHRFQQMRQIDVKAEFRRMYKDPQAEFRGVQEDALKLIVGGCPRAVIVMRTGGGKSLLFMLPAAASKGGVTIVVVPKVALQSNMKQRCVEVGIKCAVWSEDRAPPYNARIVFVIAESAISQSFNDFINSKKAAHQLERIVIDECHTILQSNEKWRPRVLQLRELAGQDVQVVCLTATLPPQKEDAFLEAMDMRVDGLQILRDVTVRPNIAYSVEEYEAGEEVEVLQELVERKKAQYPASDKIVIYCRTIKQVKEFAKVLQCTAFWRGVGTEQEKKEVLTQLTSGTERVFTSTNALGEGIDAPTIRVVIHVGIVDSLDDYGQQSGRVGRDGCTASEAIILQKVNVGKDGRRRPEQGWKTEPEMNQFLSGSVCRRVVIDRYMDGERGRKSCQADEQFCDVCRGRGTKRARVVPPEAEPITKKVRVEDQELESSQGDRRHFTQEQREFATIEVQRRESRINQGRFGNEVDDLFREWKYGCSICRIRKRPSNTGHNWRCCPYEQVNVAAVEAIKTKLIQVQWSNGRMCCRQCWAPQAICQSFDPIDSSGRMRYQKSSRRCQFVGVLKEAVAVMLLYSTDSVQEGIRRWVRQQSPEGSSDAEPTRDEGEDVFTPWLGSRIVQGEVEMSGMCWLFCQWAPASV